MWGNWRVIESVDILKTRISCIQRIGIIDLHILVVTASRYFAGSQRVVYIKYYGTKIPHELYITIFLKKTCLFVSFTSMFLS